MIDPLHAIRLRIAHPDFRDMNHVIVYNSETSLLAEACDHVSKSETTQTYTNHVFKTLHKRDFDQHRFYTNERLDTLIYLHSSHLAHV